ncbi:MAG: 23S rRNA (uracil(1939)-C(5))-methyltransferase RlmD, partial [Clostridia bacterium]|nr:23S rRNA (uracil(1939)-C(5))-methyltransferase RlmD [Clostridia bacterium]
MANKSIFKKNQTLTLKIEDITNLGFGVGRANGAVIFVSGAVKGDTCEVKIIKEASSYYVARVERFISYSPLRDKERCGNAKCRACAYRDISYAAELEIKGEAVRGAFIKAGLPEVNVLPVIPSPKLTEYRNKAQYPIGITKDGSYEIGFFAPKSHRVCEAARCPMAPSVFGDIIETLRAFFKKHSLSVYDEESGSGLLRHIYLRRSEALGSVLLTLVINGDSIPHRDELIETVRLAHPYVSGILLNVNRKKTNVILGEKFICLFGDDYIKDTLCGVELKITAPAFYQVNHGSASIIYTKARELAALSKDDVLLDLFCGAGSIGLSMADSVKEVIGIEIIESAVECAKENARSNGICNAEFYVGDATETERLLAIAEKARGAAIRPDVIVLDPPRAGCDERLLRYVAGLSPKRIVYVSCNPTTLARDAKIMKELGFDIGDVSAVDMFPGTG